MTNPEGEFLTGSFANEVAIDAKALSTRAKQRVARDGENVPIHVCGLHSHRDCPCWECSRKPCDACNSTLY